ncbi:MAG: amidase family protein, partial [Pseudomonadota bacterium]
MTASHATAGEIAAAVTAGTTTARAVAEAALARIEALNPAINAFTDVTAARALAEADAVDARIRMGRDAGPLAGVPVAVKNLADIEGLATRAGSKINRERPPATRDATLVQRLQAATYPVSGGGARRSLCEVLKVARVEHHHFGARERR